MNCTTLGIDLAKNLFQLYGVNAHGHVVMHKRVSRKKLLETVAQALSSCLGEERERPKVCHQSLSLCNQWKSRYLAPCYERLIPEHSIMSGSHQVSAAAEKIVNRTMS